MLPLPYLRARAPAPPVPRRRLRLYKKDRTPFWCQFFIQPLHAADGSLDMWVSIQQFTDGSDAPELLMLPRSEGARAEVSCFRICPCRGPQAEDGRVRRPSQSQQKGCSFRLIPRMHQTALRRVARGWQLPTQAHMQAFAVGKARVRGSSLFPKLPVL